MDRVVVLGRGGAGKSVPARTVAEGIGAPVVELDALFWTTPDLTPLPRPEWTDRQRAAIRPDARWVADGDLGPYDDLAARLPSADTTVLAAVHEHAPGAALVVLRSPRQVTAWLTALP